MLVMCKTDSVMRYCVANQFIFCALVSMIVSVWTIILNLTFLLQVVFSATLSRLLPLQWILVLNFVFFVSDVISEVGLRPFWLMLPGLGPNR